MTLCGRAMCPTKARAAAEEVANYEGELTKLRLEMGERFPEMGERIGRVESDLGLLKWMADSLIAVFLGVFPCSGRFC